MFLGPKITTVFASRWKALAWSAGVLMTAYCTVPAKDEGDANSVSADQAVADRHVSPWAIASPAPGP